MATYRKLVYSDGTLQQREKSREKKCLNLAKGSKYLGSDHADLAQLGYGNKGSLGLSSTPQMGKDY